MGTADSGAVTLGSFDPYHLTVRFDDRVAVPVTVKTSTGATKQDTVTDVVSGTADLAMIPPELTFR